MPESKPTPPLLLAEDVRAPLWERLFAAVERYVASVDSLPVAPPLDPGAIRSLLAPFDFREPLDPLAALDFAIEGLSRDQVHTPHPRYFGLFNPAPSTMGIAADALVAAFNPQLAAWSHSPLAAEIERHLVCAFGARFGYDPAQVDGVFASGGAEANHTAMLCALTHAFPRFAREGLRSLPAQPVFYISGQSHHSLLKAARLCGLGTDAAREVPVDAALRLDPECLDAQIRRDRDAGFAPFLVAATAGTTNAGVVDPLAAIAAVAREAGLWCHVDAAWGGAAVLVPEWKGLLDGIERADSITFDAHKWLSVPMAAGMFLTRHRNILERTFRIATDYMPSDAAGLDIADPYQRSIQWSRRFTGLKVFLSLAVAGWDGYAAAIRRQAEMGNLLRRELAAAGWEIVNTTELPVVCFVDGQGRSAEFLQAVAGGVVRSGAAWISTTRLRPDLPVLRACITNYRTGPEDIAALVQALDAARAQSRI